MTDKPAPSAYVTLEDVRAALADGDPFQTNAAKLRAAIGRGSPNTIQRHLDALRSEARKPTLPLVPDDAPPIPPGAADALWRAAYAAASAALLSRCDVLSREREALAVQLAARDDDVQALQGELEQLEASAARAVESLAAAVATRDQALADAGQAREALAQAEAQLKASAEAHAQELAHVQQEAGLRVETVQALVDRAASRESDLRVQLAEAQRRIDDLVQRVPPLSAKSK